MSEWGTSSLGQLIELAYGTALAAEDRSGSGYPVFGSNGIVGYHDQPLVAGPGIVVGRKGSVGALAWSNRDFWPIDTTYWVNARRGLDLRWVYEAMKSCGLQRLSSSTGVPGLNREDAYECLVQMPPPDEQQRIAEILDTFDEYIQATERVITKQLDIRHGIIRDLIERDREGWRTVRLSSVMSVFIDGDWIEAPFITNSGIRLIQTGNIGTGTYLDKPMSHRFVSPATFDLLRCSAVHAGDLLICRLADPVGRACVVPPKVGNAITAVDCTIARVDRTKADASFLCDLMSTPRWLGRCERLAAGTTRKRISRMNLGSMAVALPDVHEQRRLAAIIATIDETIRASAEQRDKLWKLRSGLAADLLSGRVRTVAA